MFHGKDAVFPSKRRPIFLGHSGCSTGKKHRTGSLFPHVIHKACSSLCGGNAEPGELTGWLFGKMRRHRLKNAGNRESDNIFHGAFDPLDQPAPVLLGSIGTGFVEGIDLG